MRLLIWASSYGQTIGGGPVLAPLLAAALAGRGHAVTVLTDRRPEALDAEEERDGVRIVRPLFRRALAGDRTLFAAVAAQVAAIRRAARPDLAFIFSSGYGELFHHLTARDAPAPLLVALHDSFPAASYRPEAMVGRNLRAASRVTACSHAVLATARRHLPLLTPISTVIHNALPMPRPVETAEPDGMRLAYLGRLVRLKGVDVLLDALALLAGHRPTLRLAIAGAGEERPALEVQAARLGLAARVDFLGALPRDAVPGFLARADLLVVPSRSEPFGLVALEAAQLARPVIASDVGGLPELIEDGRTGLLVPPDDPPALAAAIAALLDDPPRARAMGLLARARAQGQFGWDRYVDAYERQLALALAR